MCYVQGRPFLGQRIRCWEPPDYSCPAATTLSTSRWQKHSGGKQNTRNPCDNTGRYASSEESLVWNCLPTLNCHVTWTEFGWGGGGFILLAFTCTTIFVKRIVLSVFTSHMSSAEKRDISLLICFPIQCCLRRDYIGGQGITWVVQKENGIHFPLENHINIWSPCFLFCPQHQIVQPDHWITSLQPSSLSSFQKRQNSSLIPSLIVGSMGWGGPNNVNTICL